MRVGVIGCGGAGETHVRGYLENGLDVGSIYLCDVDKGKADDVASSFNIPSENVFYGDKCHLDFIGKVDVVSIATPPFERVNIVEDLSQYVKGVLIEKPLAHNVEDAVRIVNILRSYGVVDAMVYNLRFSPVFDYLKGVIKDTSVVFIYHEFGFDYLNATGWRGKPEFGGDHVVELDIHVINYVRYLLGEPKAIHSHAYDCVNEGMCRDVHTIFYFSSNSAHTYVRHGTGRSGDRYFYMNVEVHNPMDDSYRAFTDWPNFKLLHGSREVPIEEPHIWRNIYITNIIKNFISSVKGVEKPKANAIDGYRDLTIAYSIRKSIKEGYRLNKHVIGKSVEIEYTL